MSVFGLAPQADGRSAQTVETVADANTMDGWEQVLAETGEYSTENIGRIWSDKTVQTENITFKDDAAVNNPDGTPASKEFAIGDSDFLVALSALSSASNTTRMASVPLDIVLVLDTSGSMAYRMNGTGTAPTDTYEEAYPGNDTSETYYVNVNGEYYRVSYHDGIFNQGWRYRLDGWSDWVYVTPKTSEDDGNSDHVQFYNGFASQSRLYALQQAVDGFVTTTAKLNDDIDDVNQQHRISLVRFSSDGEVVSGLEPYTTDNKNSFMDYVNQLDANGATRADYGMQYANTAMESARENAKKVVIFFTDGQPTTQSSFSTEVATDAITNSKALKDEGAYVFSVAVVDGANPDAEINTSTRNNMNAYLHSVSSNYPDATGWDDTDEIWNMGDPAENSEYYYAATNADELNDIFSKIQQSVSSGLQSPTDVSSGAALNKNGYITMTDKLGDYMKVDGFKSIVYAGIRFDTVSSSTTDGVTTYVFEGKADDNGLDEDIYNSGDMADIEIEVTHGTSDREGDEVEVKIPASLIPLRKFNVNTGTGKMSVTEAYPIRIFYGVSLKDGVADKVSNPDEDMKDYISKYSDANGNVQFYSNAFPADEETGKPAVNPTLGTTTTTFRPATTNNFYFNANPIEIYTDERLTQRLMTEPTADLDLYFAEPFYQATGAADENGEYNYEVIQDKVISIKGSGLLEAKGEWTLTDEGVVINPGGPRVSTLTALTEPKAENGNPTESASAVIDPRWTNGHTGSSQDVTVYLGNNGRIKMSVPGTLAIKKSIEAAEGFTLPADNDAQFDFNIKLTSPTGASLAGEYTAVVKDAANSQIGEAFMVKVDANGNATHTIKGGETLYIYDLPAGVKYEVTESTSVDSKEKAPGFSEDTSKQSGATGVIGAAETKTASFTNVYEASSVSWPESDLKVRKTLDGRTTTTGDTFSFTIAGAYKSLDGADSSAEVTVPMPTKAANGTFEITLDAGLEGDAAKKTIDLGKIEFKVPGIYTYTINEDMGDIAGVTYTQDDYKIVVAVRDNGKGGLEIDKDNSGFKSVKPDGTESDFAYDATNNPLNFTNTYNATEVVEPLAGDKTLAGRELKAGEFSFKIIKVTDSKGVDTVTYTEGGQAVPATVPMPSGAKALGDVVWNTLADPGKPNVSFGDLTLTSDHVGHTYTYTIVEVDPGEGSRKPGVTYDTAESVVTVEVSDEETDNGTMAVVAKVTTSDNQAQEKANRFLVANSYAPASVKLEGDGFVKGQKVLAGREPNDGEEFAFTLSATNDLARELMPTALSVTVDKADFSNGNAFFNFGDMTFTKAGTYTFSVEEDVTGMPEGQGMTYDKHVAEVVIKMSEQLDNQGNHTGQLVPSVTYNNNTENAPGTVKDVTNAAAFYNEYRASATYADIHVEKVLTAPVDSNRKLEADDFAFTITPLAGNGTSADDAANKVKNQSDLSFENEDPGNDCVALMLKLAGMEFSQDDAGKTYVYLVDEVEPKDDDDATDGIQSAGVTYDQSRFRVTIAVNDDKVGNLTIVTKVEKLDTGDMVVETTEFIQTNDPATHATMRFTNSYQPKPTTRNTATLVPGLKKVVSGRDWLENESFEFTWSAVSTTANGLDVVQMPTPVKGDNPLLVTNLGTYKDGEEVSVTGFGELTFDRVGTYVYTVSETVPTGADNGMTYDASPITVTIQVTDDGRGGLEAKATTNRSAFINTYSSDATFGDGFNMTLTKQVDGHALVEETFEFVVTAADSDTVKAADTAQKLGMGDELTYKDKNPLGAADGVAANVFTDMFAGAKFTQEDSGKTFSVEFTETDVKLAGYTCDKKTYRVDITPQDDPETGVMTLTVKVFKNDSKNPMSTSIWTEGDTEVPVTLPFVNMYEAEGTLEGKTALKVTKTLLGRDWKDKETFEFKVDKVSYQKDAASDPKNDADTLAAMPAPTDPTIKVGESGGAFGDIKFTTPGIYTYEVSEVAGAETGMSYSNVTYTVTVTVTDKGDGTLETSAAYTTGGTSADAMEFINAYQEKKVSGTASDGTIQVGQELTYTIEYVNGETSTADITIKDTVPAGTELVSTDPQAQTEVVDGKTVATWTIDDVQSGKGGEVTMVVRVTEDAVTMVDLITNQAEVKIGDRGPIQTNEVETPLAKPGALTISKTVDAGTGGAVDTNKTFEFTVELTDAAKKTLTGKYAITDVDGKKAEIELSDQGKATFQLKHDQSVTIEGLPAGATYKVVETAAAGYTTTIKDGSDAETDGMGTITAGATSTVAFTNTYSSVVPSDKPITTDNLFTKVFTGRDWTKDDNFTFKITALNVPEGQEDTWPMPEKTEVTINGENAVENAEDNEALDFGFGTIEFTFNHIKDVAPNEKGERTKTFEYVVTEEHAGEKINGITYDSHKALLSITVTDNGKGEMTGSHNISTVARTSGNVFTNRYNAELDYDGLRAGFEFFKHLEGREIQKDQFHFKVDAVETTTASASEAGKLVLGEDQDGNAIVTMTYGSNASNIEEWTHKSRVAWFTTLRDLNQTDAGKVYAFEISETDQGNDHYECDHRTFLIEIAVTDNGDGTLSATTKATDKATGELIGDPITVSTNDAEVEGDAHKRVQVTFENVYEAGPIDVAGDSETPIVAKKTMINRDPVADEFLFHISLVNVAGDSEKLIASARNDADGNVTFDKMQYTTDQLDEDVANGLAKVQKGKNDEGKEDGSYDYTYKYRVYEDASKFEGTGVSAIEDSFIVTVVVTDYMDGHMDAEVVYPENPDGSPGSSVEFKNSYGAGVTAVVAVSGEKNYVTPGDGWTAPDIKGQFTFELSGSDGAPMPAVTKVTLGENPMVRFGEITYTMENVFGTTTADEGDVDGADDAAMKGPRSKTFTYTVTEAGAVQGVKNDQNSSQTFTVTVTDDGSGNLTAVADPATGFKFSFTNTYSTTPATGSVTDNFTITKKLDGRALAAEEFEFALYAADGSKVASAKNGANGNVEFPAMTFNTPGSYEYTLKEVAATNVDNGITYDTSSYKVVAGVVDNGKGALEVTWAVFDGIEDVSSNTPIVFTNTYETTATSATFGAAKLLDGADLAKDQFTFELINKDGKVIATAKNDADGNIQFPSVELKYEGTYKFSVAEKNDGQEGVTYDDTVYGIDVVVTDDGKGHLVAEVKYEGDTAPVFKNTYTKPVDPTSEPKPEEPAKPTLPTTGDTAWAQTAIAALAAGTGLIAWGVKKRKRS